MVFNPLLKGTKSMKIVDFRRDLDCSQGIPCRSFHAGFNYKSPHLALSSSLDYHSEMLILFMHMVYKLQQVFVSADYFRDFLAIQHGSSVNPHFLFLSSQQQVFNKALTVQVMQYLYRICQITEIHAFMLYMK